MNRVFIKTSNFRCISFFFVLSIVSCTISFKAYAQSFKCGLTPEKAQSLVEQASSLNAVEYEEALLKFVNGERLTNYERMLSNTAEVFLKTATPEAIKSREEQRQAVKNTELKEIETQRTQMQGFQEQMQDLQEIVEKKQTISKDANQFSNLAENKMRTHKIYAAMESSTARATTAELRLLNQLLRIMIEQNDKMLRYTEEQKNEH